MYYKHYVKSVRFWSFSGPYFLAFGLNTEIIFFLSGKKNTEIYSVNLHIQSEYEKIRTRKTPNTDIFYEVKFFDIFMKMSLILMVNHALSLQTTEFSYHKLAYVCMFIIRYPYEGIYFARGD